MSIFERIKCALGLGPRLKNRAGGLAWIKPFGAAHGAHVLANRVVRTVALVHGTAWQIDPPQGYTVTGGGVHLVYSGVRAKPGQAILIIALSDDLLEPIPEIGEDQRDESARWLPPTPIHRAWERA